MTFTLLKMQTDIKRGVFSFGVQLEICKLLILEAPTKLINDCGNCGGFFSE